jgi:hypothetical protein
LNTGVVASVFCSGAERDDYTYMYRSCDGEVNNSQTTWAFKYGNSAKKKK